MADVDMPDASSSSPAKAKTSGLIKALKPGATAEGGLEVKKRFEVKKVSRPLSQTQCPSGKLILDKWNAVALWAWDIVVDNCAICRNHIMDLC